MFPELTVIADMAAVQFHFVNQVIFAGAPPIYLTMIADVAAVKSSSLSARPYLKG
jgi:hypothetical protein